MKPAPFKYVAAGSLEDALRHLDEHGDDAKVIAGGQSLMPLMALRMVRPEILVDINRIGDLAHIRSEHGAIRIGAMVRQDDLGSDGTARRLPLLAQALRHLGHPATRSRGTVGGSLAHADPAAELPICMLAFEAEFGLRSRGGERTVAADGFFSGPLTTVLEPGELLTEIRIPAQESAHTGSAFLEVARRHGDFALVAVACVLAFDGGRLSRVRLAAGGVSDRPVRLTEAEAALEGQDASAEAFEQAARLATRSIDPMNDLHATADYRRQVAVTLARRALQVAHDAANRGRD